MVNAEAADVLRAVAKLKPWTDESQAGRAEGVFGRASNLLMSGSAIALIVALALLGGTRLSFWSLDAIRVFALGDLIVVIVGSFMGLVAQTVKNLIGLARIWRRGDSMLPIEFQHDAGQARALAKFGRDALTVADAWLGRRIDRLDRRIALIFGKPDAVALASLLAAGYAGRKAMVELVTSNPKLDWPIMLIGALIAGAATGAMLAKLKASREAYWRDLIALSKQLKPQQVEGQVTSDKHPASVRLDSRPTSTVAPRTAVAEATARHLRGTTAISKAAARSPGPCRT